MSQSIPDYGPPPSAGKNICLIVGFTCLFGFIIDTLVLSTPIEPFALQWRINVLQQLGDRSIVLLFAVALLMYAFFDQRRLKRPLGFVCLALGVAFMLSCVLVIRDSLILQSETLQNISNQEQQAQSQIKEAQDGNVNLPESVTTEQLRQASQQLSSQASTLKQNARQGITKAGVASMGNLIAVGLGMIGLGRLGIKRK